MSEEFKNTNKYILKVDKAGNNPMGYMRTLKHEGVSIDEFPIYYNNFKNK